MSQVCCQSKQRSLRWRKHSRLEVLSSISNQALSDQGFYQLKQNDLKDGTSSGCHTYNDSKSEKFLEQHQYAVQSEVGPALACSTFRQFQSGESVPLNSADRPSSGVARNVSSENRDNK